MIEVTRLDAWEELPRSVWDRLAAGLPFYAQRAWFAAATRPGRLHLLIAWSRGEALALLPLFIVDSPVHYYHSPREIFCGPAEQQLLRSLNYPMEASEQAAAAAWFPAAISISPYGYRGSVISALRGGDAAPVVAALAAAADDLCRREGVRVALFYGLRSDADLPLLAALAGRGAVPVVLGAHCDLEVRFRSLEEYFEALGERGRRLRSKHRQAMAHGGSQMLTAESGGFEPWLVEPAVQLFVDSARRHGESSPPVRLYRELLTSWPERRYLLSSRLAGGELSSALLVLTHGDTLYPKLWGARVRGDYFFLTYSRLVELAIASGARRIAYGGGSHGAKLLRGARLVWLLGAIQAYEPRLAKSLARLLPLYQAAKIQHFSALASRFQIDHLAPDLPTIPRLPAPSPRAEKGVLP